MIKIVLPSTSKMFGVRRRLLVSPTEVYLAYLWDKYPHSGNNTQFCGQMRLGVLPGLQFATLRWHHGTNVTPHSPVHKPGLQANHLKYGCKMDWKLRQMRINANRMFLWLCKLDCAYCWQRLLWFTIYLTFLYVRKTQEFFSCIIFSVCVFSPVKNDALLRSTSMIL